MSDYETVIGSAISRQLDLETSLVTVSIVYSNRA